jgi:hypothetical protein
MSIRVEEKLNTGIYIEQRLPYDCAPTALRTILEVMGIPTKGTPVDNFLINLSNLAGYKGPEKPYLGLFLEDIDRLWKKFSAANYRRGHEPFTTFFPQWDGTTQDLQHNLDTQTRNGNAVLLHHEDSIHRNRHHALGAFRIDSVGTNPMYRVINPGNKTQDVSGRLLVTYLFRHPIIKPIMGIKKGI